MNLFRTMAAVLALSTGLLTLPAHADAMSQNGGARTAGQQQNASGNTMYTNDAPRGYAMMGDLLIARPLLICATLIGTAAFIVTLPFSALGGNVPESADALIGEPGREAFVRCLGCDTSNSSYSN